MFSYSLLGGGCCYWLEKYLVAVTLKWLGCLRKISEYYYGFLVML